MITGPVVASAVIALSWLLYPVIMFVLCTIWWWQDGMFIGHAVGMVLSGCTIVGNVILVFKSKPWARKRVLSVFE